MATRPLRIVLSCEHAGNRVPGDLIPQFAGCDALDSHRGFDIGALKVAQVASRRLELPLYETTVSRLVVDTNRSETNPRVFSEWTSGLAKEERQRLLDRYHRPHRMRVESALAEAVSHGPTLHLAVHSFTPALDGTLRNADVGLLYDPKRCVERNLADRYEEVLLNTMPELRIRRNYPYKGTADGLTTAMRKRFGDRYAGIELELNQAHLTGDRSIQEKLTDAVIAGIEALRNHPPS